MPLIDSETGKKLTPEDGQVTCNHCDTPYAYEANILTSEYIWVRRCKAACKRKPQDARFDRSNPRRSPDGER